MAERRMFAKTIIDSDAFLEMPLSAQALYFHLNMRADDEGFVNNPRKISRLINASDDDLKILAGKSFIIPFESGVIVIKHWKLNNYIQSDRFKPTVYSEERAMLSTKENNVYTLDTDCIQNGYSLDTQYSIDKYSIDKISIVKDNNIVGKPDGKTEEIRQIIDYFNYVCGTNYRYNTKATNRLINARLNEGFSVDDFKTVIDKKFKAWKDDKKMREFIRPATLFSGKFEDYLNETVKLDRMEEVDLWREQHSSNLPF